MLGSDSNSLERDADRVAELVPQPSGEAGPSYRPLSFLPHLSTPLQRSAKSAASRTDYVDTAVEHVLAKSQGEPLPRDIGAEMSRQIGADLAHVRIHSGPEASTSAAALGANAYTVGTHVVFGKDTYRPLTREGRRLIAHEMTHVVQQSGGRVVRRQPADRTSSSEFFGGFYVGDDPMSRYTALKRLSPSTYAAFSATVKRRILQFSLSGENIGPESTANDTVEVILSVRELVQPMPPKPGIADLRARLWPLVAERSEEVDAIADVLRDEVAGRWARENEDLLGAPVRIRLLPPEHLPPPIPRPGPGNLFEFESPPILVFDIAGEPVGTQDGSLALLELDMLGSNNLEKVAATIGEEATTIARAGDLLRASTVMLEVETQFWEKVRNNPDAVASNEVDAHFNLFSLTVGGEGPAAAPLPLELVFFLDGHPEYQSELGETSKRLGELTTSVWESYLQYRKYFEAELASPEISSTMREGVDFTWVRAREMGEEGVLEGGLGYAVAGLTEGLYFIMNSLSAGYPEARHEAVRTFRSGQISYDQLEELTAAAAGRGAAVGLVSLALTGVTAGLAAGPLLGASATIGRQVVFGAAAGGASGIITAGTTSAISRLHSFDDPTMDKIWGMGRLGPGEILASGLFGAGIGTAAVPIGIAFGKLAAWWRAGPGGVGFGPVKAPPGWAAEQIADDLVRYTTPDVPGEFIVGRGTIRYQVPTGTGMRVVTELPIGGPGPAAGTALVGASRSVPLSLPGEVGEAVAKVWLNPKSGVYHLRGSRWYGKTAGGRFATIAEAEAAGFRRAGTFPPTGVYAVERPPLGEPRVVIRSKLGRPMWRRGYEKQYALAAEYALEEIAGWQRAHSQGAGIGAESGAAIRLATKEVNQELQKEGVERTMRGLVEQLQPGDELHLTTVTTTHQGTLRLKDIQYRLFLHRPGSQPRVVFEVGIELSRSGRARTTAELFGLIAEEVAR
jgi:Domain of unknown function (DUF4157)/Bacterial toxin 4